MPSRPEERVDGKRRVQQIRSTTLHATHLLSAALSPQWVTHVAGTKCEVRSAEIAATRMPSMLRRLNTLSPIVVKESPN